MRCFLGLLLLVFLIFSPFLGLAQPFTVVSSTHYGRDKGTMTSPVFHMSYDENGFLWLSSRIGTQRFDGTRFHDIPTHQELKGNNQNAHFFRLKNGRLTISIANIFTIYDGKTNAFEKHILPINNVGQLELIIEKGDNTQGGGEYWFVGEKAVYCIDKKTFKHKIDPILLESISSHSVVDTIAQKIYLQTEKALLVIDLITKKYATQLIKLNENMHGMFVLSRDKILIFQSSGWAIWSPESQTISSLKPYPNGYVQTLKPIKALAQSISKDKIIVAFGTQLWEFDINKCAFTHVFVNEKNQNLIDKGYFSAIATDGEQKIWLASNIEGLQRLMGFSRIIKNFTLADKKANFSKCLLVDKKNNRVISGTYEQGIAIFDTLQRLIKHIPHIETNQPDKNIVTTIIDLNEKECIFLLFLSENVHILNKLTGQIRTIKRLTRNNEYAFRSFGYYSTFLKDNEGTIYYPFLDKLVSFTAQNANYQIKEYQINNGSHANFFTQSGYMIAGKMDSLFVFKDKQLIKAYSLGKTFIKHIAEDKNNVIWVATENKLLQLDPTTFEPKQEWTTQNGLPDNTIYALAIDANNRLWFSHNKGISVKIDNAFITFNKEDGLQDNEFNTGSVAQTNDGQLFFGGINGISSFYPDDILRLVETPSVFLTQLNVMGSPYLPDTAIWQIDKIELPYNQNRINFNLSALGFHDIGIYNFQVRMVGIDNEWINLGQLHNTEYQLPIGSFRFDFVASRDFNPKATAFRSLIIEIKPPFWRTWWFILLMITFVSIILWQSVRLYFHRKYRKRMRQLEMQKRVQQEKVRISRDLHDNMGAQLSHIVRSVEWFSKHGDVQNDADKELLENVNATAKEAMITLRESIWTLNKEIITVSDFWERYKKWASPLLKSAPQTELLFKESIEKNNVLTPEQSLQLFRILQEALNNTLKYAQATKIAVQIEATENQTISLVFSDNGQGFDVQENMEKGNGLVNMQQRAEGIGAIFALHSTTGMGTEIGLAIA